MKKWMKYGLIIVIVGLVVGAGTVYYVFNKPHRNILGETPAYIMPAASLFGAFSEDENASLAKYGDQVIQVKGAIANISNEGYNVTLILDDEMEGVSCTLDSLSIAENQELINNLKNGDTVELKGKCDGYDMIMGVVLTRCFMIE